MILLLLARLSAITCCQCPQPGLQPDVFLSMLLNQDLKWVILISHLFHRYQFINQFLRGVNVHWVVIFQFVDK